METPALRSIGVAFWPVAVATVVLCASASAARAQAPPPAGQTVSGQVSDSSGAVIVGSKIVCPTLPRKMMRWSSSRSESDICRCRA